ncbi:MAG: SGNH/GDSL hydrolase family protein, partial [Gemmatimonadaceae bacterium]
MRSDWAGPSRYRAANDSMPVRGPNENRVVYIGDSITESWTPYFPALFPGKRYIGRGISGQTTPQILVRFRQDVVGLRPKVVVILAGTNDVAGNTGPSTLEMITDNIASMAEIARANGIRVVLSSVLPVYDYPWKRGLNPVPKTAALNAWIRRYAEETGAVYLDYHSAMADSLGGLRAELTSDGVHPNVAGYAVMAPLAEEAINKAISLPLVRAPGSRALHHYVFFGMDREKIREATSFLETSALEGAQVAYSWRQLEPDKDSYDFSLIREDLAFLQSRGKKLFIQLQDVTFSASRVNVPRYLLLDPIYNGGADKQYEFTGTDEQNAVVGGWAARRWDPAVQERFHRLLDALGREFDGRVEGINFAEGSVGFGETGRLFPSGFSFERYRDAIITNMRALKRAFPTSVAMQYGNFMPGEWRATNDKGYLRAVYAAAREFGVGVGGPDLLPHRPGQLLGSYPLIREAAGIVPTGIAV